VSLPLARYPNQRIEHHRPSRMTKERCWTNIATVAREAGKSTRSVLDAERLERKRLIELLRLARERLKPAERDVVRIASENARLVTENGGS
jgi:hypothetical protein